jgi:hypothetical protein
MKWGDVGDWLQANGGTGASLIGSLLVGNAPGAVAAGVALVSSATGVAGPDAALARLQADPATVVRLRELAAQDEASIREHIRAMTELELADKQASHHETQETIRAGDKSEHFFVRFTRPGQSWLSLVSAITYVGYCTHSDKVIDITVLGLLLTLPWAYAGLREAGKGIAALASVKLGRAAK